MGGAGGGGGGQGHAPAAVPQEWPGTHSIGRWVGPEEGLDRLEKFHPPAGFESPDRPARSESLYRLSYPGTRDPRCTFE
jgi:hypothetical protein